MNKRYEYLDFAKGLAVIFMVVQHIGIWMWKMPWSKVMADFKGHSIYITLNTLSGLSAPIFLFSAGAGAFLLMEKYTDNRKIIKRGLIILLLGYIHNLTITYWFNYGSWYVLHLIGFSFLLAPLLRKLKKKTVVLIAIGILLLTYLIQTGLETPLLLTNKKMSNMSLNFAILRLAFVEGHFPILPWISFFLIGFLSISVFSDEDKAISIVLIGISLLLVGAILIGLGVAFPSLKESMLSVRLFYIKPRFYPMLLPMLLFLLGLVLISMQIIKIGCSRLKVSENNPIVLIGRFSLTIFFTHVYVKFFLYHYKLNQTFSKPVTMLSITAFLLFFTALSYWAKHTNYKYTLEGLLRKLS